MRAEAGDRNHPALRAARQIGHRGHRQLVECEGHHRKGALQPLTRQVCKAPAIGESCGVHDRIDGSERGPRSIDQFGRNAGAREIAALDFDPGTRALAFRRRRLQAREPGRISTLPMQHQALIFRCQTPRDRRADAGPASGDDGNPHAPPTRQAPGASNYRCRTCKCKRRARPARVQRQMARHSEPPHAQALVAPAAAALQAVLIDQLDRAEMHEAVAAEDGVATRRRIRRDVGETIVAFDRAERRALAEGIRNFKRSARVRPRRQEAASAARVRDGRCRDRWRR